MKTIWKYNLLTADEQVIEVPIGFIPLSIQVQDGRPRLWCLVDPDAPNNESVTINTLTTGRWVSEIGKMGEFIGTYQLLNGNFVGHVFMARNG